MNDYQLYVSNRARQQEVLNQTRQDALATYAAGRGNRPNQLLINLVTAVAAFVVVYLRRS